MVGPTLSKIREHIDTLATSDGQYYLVCGRTGDRPVPANDKRFPTRATARAAARATEQYRAALRRYDPRVPYYDLIVCEEGGCGPTVRHHGNWTTARLSGPVVSDDSASDRRSLVEFCHRVAGALFETLSKEYHDDVESAIMDAYFAHAEAVGPDELCLCLLESMSREIQLYLSPADQANLLADAVERLGPAEGTTDPLGATLDTLTRRGLVESYTRSSGPAAPDDTGGAAVVNLSGYALSVQNERLPVLPLTLELWRYRVAQPVGAVRVAGTESGWQVRVVLADAGARDGLVSAPVVDAV